MCIRDRDNHMHFLYQEGRTGFKYAVSNMSDACVAIAERNNLTKDNIDVYKRQVK